MDSQSQAELIQQAIASCERAIALLQEEIDASEEIEPLVLCQPLDTAIQQNLDMGKTTGDLHDELMNLSESQDASSLTEGNQTLAKPQPGLMVKLADASSMTTNMDEKKIFNNDAINTSTGVKPPDTDLLPSPPLKPPDPSLRRADSTIPSPLTKPPDRDFRRRNSKVFPSPKPPDCSFWETNVEFQVTRKPAMLPPPEPPDLTYGTEANPPPSPEPPDKVAVPTLIVTTITIDLSSQWGRGDGYQNDPFPSQLGQTQPNSWASKKCSMRQVITPPLRNCLCVLGLLRSFHDIAVFCEFLTDNCVALRKPEERSNHVVGKRTRSPRLPWKQIKLKTLAITSNPKWFSPKNEMVLLSNNSAFSFRFLTTLDVTLFLLVVKHLSSYIVALTATRGSLVRNSDKFVFGHIGNTYLNDGKGVVWETNTTGQKLRAKEWLDSWNLVLLGENGATTWQGFKMPHMELSLLGEARRSPNNVTCIGDDDMYRELWNLCAGKCVCCVPAFEAPIPSMESPLAKIENAHAGTAFAIIVLNLLIHALIAQLDRIFKNSGHITHDGVQDRNTKLCSELVICLRVTIALYGSLCQYHKAIPILESLVLISSTGHMQLGLAKIASHMQLGDTYAMLGRFENSITCYTTEFEDQRQVLGNTDPRIGKTRRYVTTDNFHALQVDDTRRLCLMPLEIYKAHSSASSLEEATDRRLMGLVGKIQGNTEAALEQMKLHPYAAIFPSLVMDLNRWEARKVGMSSLLLLGCLLAVRTLFGFHEKGFWVALSIGKIGRLQIAQLVSMVQIVQLDGTSLSCALPDMGLLIEPNSFAALVNWHGSSTDNTFGKIWQDWKNSYNLEDKVVFNGGSNVMSQNEQLGQNVDFTGSGDTIGQLAQAHGEGHMAIDPQIQQGRRGMRDKTVSRYGLDFTI